MVTQLQPDVRAYIHGGEVIKRYMGDSDDTLIIHFPVGDRDYCIPCIGKENLIITLPF